MKAQEEILFEILTRTDCDDVENWKPSIEQAKEAMTTHAVDVLTCYIQRTGCGRYEAERYAKMFMEAEPF